MDKTSAGLALAAVLAMVPVEARDLQSVGVSVSELGNPFFVQIGRGVESRVAELGGPAAEVMVVCNSDDLDTQIRQIEDFIAAGVQMIVLTAADPEAIRPVLDNARQAGIVVIAVDVAGADAAVMSDIRQAGPVACRYPVERPNGSGRIVIVNDPPVSSAIDRVAGCKSVIENHPDIEVHSDKLNGGGNREGGLAVTTALLLSYPEIDAIFAVNDPSAIGAALAARQAYRDEFFIVSVDGSPDAVTALQDQISRIAATAAQDPQIMAACGVDIDVPAGERRDEIGSLARAFDVFERNSLKLDEASRRLAENNRLLETVFRSLNDGLSVFDAAGRLLSWNPKFVEFCELQPALAKSGTPIAVIHEDLAQKHLVTRGLDGRVLDPAAIDLERRLSNRRFEENVPDARILQLRSSPLPQGCVFRTNVTTDSV